MWQSGIEYFQSRVKATCYYYDDGVVDGQTPFFFFLGSCLQIANWDWGPRCRRVTTAQGEKAELTEAAEAAERSIGGEHKGAFVLA